MHNRKGWFGFGGHHGRRFFEKGDLKYVILELLAEKPRHGYEIMRDLETRFGGLYAPSPGSVYPTLQMMEDLGYVEATHQDGKKIYHITDTGNAFLAERDEVLKGIHDRMSAMWNPAVRNELRDLLHEVGEIARTLSRLPAREEVQPETLRKIREVIVRARREIEDILAP